MEQLSGVEIVEHELNLLIRFQVLQVAPVGVQIVLDAVIRYDQYHIGRVLFEGLGGYVAGVEDVILAGVHDLAGVVGV